MRFKDFVTEATGGLARRFLEKGQGKDTFFLDQNKNRWELDDVSFWPADPALSYDTDEVGTAFDKITDEVNTYLSQRNLKTINEFGTKTKKSKSLAAMIVVVSLGNEHIAYIRYVNHKHSIGNNPITWTNTAFQTATGLTLQSPQMKKASIKIDPADIIKPDSMYTVDSLIGAVSQSIQGTTIPETIKQGIGPLLTNIRDNLKTPVPSLAEHKPVIEIKLGEIAGPIALMTGHLTSGAYAQAGKELIGPLGGTWTTSNGVSFPPKAELLVDSYIHFPNGIVSVSSKDASGGAKPSIRTIIDTIDSKSDQFDEAFLRKNQLYIETLRLLNNKSAIDGVLEATQYFENISEYVGDDDIKWLRSIYGKGNVSRKGMPNGLGLLLSSSRYQKVDYTHPEYQLGYHILAVLARSVVDEINSDRTRVTNFFKAVLNKSNLVQVLTRTKSVKDALFFDNFTVIWPPVFTGNILANAGSYTSRTPPSRKIAFEFK